MQVGSNRDAKSEINVTPLVDVVLVLLIIFMIITPIILQETLIHLPKVDLTDEPPDPNDPGALVVKLNADGSLALRVGDAEEDVNQDMLLTKLSAQLAARKEKNVFVDASTLVNYGQVVNIFDLVKGTGATLAVVETDENADQASGGAAPATAP